MNLEFGDPSFDDPKIAQSILSRSSGVLPQKRTSPCFDCAAFSMYRDCITVCQKYLTAEQRAVVAGPWDCHHGGRCEGTWQLLVGGGES